MAKNHIEIEYCTSCNYLPRALWIASELLPDFQYDIPSFTFTCGSKGVFEVRFGDKLVFSKVGSGRFPDPDELKQAIFAEMEANP